MTRNAIKHGFLAREVVITAGDGEESREEFDALMKSLWCFYQPVGGVEELLVQTIGSCWWRKARVIRAENGEIRKRLDTSAVDYALQASDKANLTLALAAMDLDLYSRDIPADAKVSSEDRWSAIQAVQTNLRGHRSGLAYLAALLMKAKSEMASEGYLSEGSRKDILLGFCFWDCLFALTCVNASPPEAKVEGQPPDSPEDKQTGEKRREVTAFIEDRLKMISDFKGYALERDQLQLDADTRSCSLPPLGATDKLIRYEAHLDRQLYRAMDQLERLQRQRRGEKVPPPLNINLGRRN